MAANLTYKTTRPGTGRTAYGVRGIVLVIAVTTLLPCARAYSQPGDGAESQRHVARTAFSQAMFRDINEADALAAVKVWSQAAAREAGVDLASEVMIHSSLAAMRDGLRTGLVDCAGMTTREFLAIEPDIPVGSLFAAVDGDGAEQEYVILARADAGIETIQDLAGRSMVVYDNPRMCLAIPWLETIAARISPATDASPYEDLRQETKLTQVILPVFFESADACVATRQGYEIMADLNPQIGNKLRIVATSERIVPMVFVISGDYTPSFLDRFLLAMASIHETPDGQQILQLLNSDRIDACDRSSLDSASRLLDEWAEARLDGSLIAGSTVSGVSP